MVIELNDNNFSQSVLQHKGVAIVDFWATWCAPCRMQAPIFEETAKSLGDEVLFAKVNVDENMQIANDLKIVSIPTLIIFKDGQPVDKIVGLSQSDEIISTLKKDM